MRSRKMQAGGVWLPILLGIAGFFPAEATGQGNPGDREVRRWVEELGASDYAVRERASENLLRTGLDAFPFVEEGTRSEDPEKSERAIGILYRFSFTPALLDEAGQEIGRYESAGSEEKALLIDQAFDRARKECIPFLRAVIAAENDPRALEAAIGHSYDLEREGMSRWIEDRAEGPSVPAPIHRRLAQCFVQRDLPLENLLRHTDRVLARGGGLSDPMAYTDWFLALIRERQRDALTKLFAAGKETLLSSGKAAVEAAHSLLRGREIELASELASSLLERYPLDEDLKGALAKEFLEWDEPEEALKIAATMGSPPSDVLRRAYRLAWLPREACHLARAQVARGGEEPWLRLRGIEDLLYFGLAGEANDCFQAIRDTLRADSFRTIEFQLAVSRADFESAVRLRPESGEPPDKEPAPDLNWALRFLDRAQGERVESLPVDPEESRGYYSHSYRLQPAGVAERDGRRGEALLLYCEALADPNPLTGWRLEEVERKAAYLARLDGAVEEAIRLAVGPTEWERSHEEKEPISEFSRRWNEDWRRQRGARVVAEIRRRAGDFIGASEDLERILGPRDTLCSDEDRLDAAWFHFCAGSLDRAEAILAPLRDGGHGRSAINLRIAFHLSLLVARGRGELDLAAVLREALARPAGPEVYASGVFLLSRGVDGAALREFLKIENARGEESAEDRARRLHARRHISRILARRGDLEGAARYLLLSFRSNSGNAPPPLRARLELARARLALARGSTTAARESLEGSLALDPFLVPAALLLRDLARETDPETAARAGSLAVAELRRLVRLEPLNPNAHAELARALESGEEAEEAAAARKRAEALRQERMLPAGVPVDTDPGPIESGRETVARAVGEESDAAAASTLEALFDWFDGLGFPDVAKLDYVIVHSWIRPRFEGFLLEDGGDTFTVLTPGLQRFAMKGPTSNVAPLERARFEVADFQEVIRTRSRVSFYPGTPTRRGSLVLRSFLLARWCDRRGMTGEARKIFSSLAHVDERLRHGRSLADVLLEDVANAWYWQIPARFDDPDANRMSLLDESRRFASNFAGTLEGVEAAKVAALLESMLAEESGRANPTRSLDEMPAGERAAELVFQLRNQTERPVATRNGCFILSNDPADTSPAARLVEMGLDAVPRLIEAIADERFTRAVSSVNRYGDYRVLRVGDCATAILERIAGRTFHPWVQLGDSIHADGVVGETRARAETWWARVQSEGERALLVEATRAGDEWSVYNARRLLARYPDVALDAMSEGVRAAGGSGAGRELVRLAGSIEGDAPVEFLLAELSDAEHPWCRIEAARALQSRERPEALAVMIREWESSGRPEPPGEVVDFLLSSGDPVAIHALAAGLMDRPIWLRGSVVAHAGKPERMGKIEKGFDEALEELLMAALDDKDTEFWGDAFRIGGRRMSPYARVCDMAALVLGQRWPDRYTFNPAAALEGRDRALVVAKNSWRRARGLPEFPVPDLPALPRAPEETVGPILDRAVSDDPEGAILELEALGLAALPAAREWLGSLAQGTPARARLEALASR
ncbi:MAG: hypothetical protein HY720_08410, partial [Planctomycetes bacterium]|nr:hypothetical protein [Planctomycetota bacterium]